MEDNTRVFVMFRIIIMFSLSASQSLKFRGFLPVKLSHGIKRESGISELKAVMTRSGEIVVETTVSPTGVLLATATYADSMLSKGDLSSAV